VEPVHDTLADLRFVGGGSDVYGETKQRGLTVR
jgi:hypothetical protein